MKLSTTAVKWLQGAIACAVLGACCEPSFAQGTQSFSFAEVKRQASELASRPYQAVPDDLPKGTQNLDYDQFRQIRFRRERTLWRGEGLNFEMQMLPIGWLYKAPVELLVVENNTSRQIAPDNSYFDLGPLAGKLAPEARLGFSGFRLLSPMNRPDLFDEVIVFQGASYFRAVSRGQVYGLSARGLALNVGEASGEEFPTFRRFWIEKPKPGAEAVAVYALLDSPSVAGAYRIVITPGAPTVTEVELALYPRQDLANVGIAPLTSMYLFGPLDRSRISDFREAVHDSDALAVDNGYGEHLWRPLSNPKRLQTSHFVDENPKGFGLIQRSRRPEDFQDLEAAYERRPGGWVQTSANWGPGAVALVEIPTDEEIHDNIVAFWRPSQPLPKGKEWSTQYVLAWPNDATRRWSGARVVATRSGLINGPRRKSGIIQFAVDFEGLPAAPSGELPSAKVEVSAGEVSSVVVQPNPMLKEGGRASFSFDPKGTAVAEFRLQMFANNKPVSETWLYRWTSK